jgi:hypothetical protein
MMAGRAEVVTGNFPPLGSAMAQEKDSLALVGSGSAADESGSEALQRLFEAFVECRTTLDDLSSRAALLGENLSGPIIAAHMTGTSCMSAQRHNVVAAAINLLIRRASRGRIWRRRWTLYGRAYPASAPRR